MTVAHGHDGAPAWRARRGSGSRADAAEPAIPRSYALVAATRVARSTSSDEGRIPATRRWTTAETKERIAAAPAFHYPSPDDDLLADLIWGYEHITGDPVRRSKKRNYVAACYRVHGDDFLPLVQRLFASWDTAVNLLGYIRCLDPARANRRGDELNDEPPAEPGAGAFEPDPGLTYARGDAPPFDPTSHRRHDRRPSNPDATGFFSDDGPAEPRRSPTAEALGR